MIKQRGVACRVEGLGLRCRAYPTPHTPHPTLWLLVAVLALLLMAAPFYTVSAESPPGPGVSEPTPTSDPLPLDLPNYRDPESPLPGAGVTSQVFTALGTVLGILALGVYLYKRVARRGPRANLDGTVRILTRTYLGPKESLCLVQVGADILLLGQTAAGITLLHTLPSGVSAVPAGGGPDEATIGPIGGVEERIPSGYTRERGSTPAGLESRLRRLNTLWGTEVPE